ncbi:MAG TPA: peptidoglycan-binding protein [bacterium]|nr:peptidoglycan-binding protein [bacterium]
MTKTLHLSFFALLGGLLIFSGCATKKTKKDISALQSQVGALTDELTRLDQSLQETRASIQEQQNKISSLESRRGSGSARSDASVSAGIYRTPSGFELPARNIQQALKNAGYYQGSIDGKVGSQTRGAIQAFQRDNGLGTDGVVGRQTWSKLKVYLER